VSQVVRGEAGSYSKMFGNVAIPNCFVICHSRDDFFVSVRFLFVALFVLFVEVARGQGTYQTVRNGKALVWNDNPKTGDEATWSGGRDRDGYARGFGTLTWYTKEQGSDKPQLYALYWGNMVHGKLNGPVNAHSKKKTHYAIFADGTRVTAWSAGTAPSHMTQQQVALIAEHKASRVPESEPEPPAAGPVEKRKVLAFAESERDLPTAVPAEKQKASSIPQPEPRSPVAGPVEKHNAPTIPESEPEPPAAGPVAPRPEDIDSGPEPEASIQDWQSESWSEIGIDDSLRILVFPPRTLERYARRSRN